MFFLRGWYSFGGLLLAALISTILKMARFDEGLLNFGLSPTAAATVYGCTSGGLVLVGVLVGRVLDDRQRDSAEVRATQRSEEKPEKVNSHSIPAAQLQIPKLRLSGWNRIAIVFAAVLWPSVIAALLLGSIDLPDMPFYPHKMIGHFACGNTWNDALPWSGGHECTAAEIAELERQHFGEFASYWLNFAGVAALIILTPFAITQGMRVALGVGGWIRRGFTSGQ